MSKEGPACETRISGRTAIARGSASYPLRLLAKPGTLYGEVLHFGCGKDRPGTALIRGVPGVSRVAEYDPNHAPGDGVPQEKRYDTLVCSYVLNVLPPMERMRALLASSQALRPEGAAYYAVRGRSSGIAGTPYLDGVRTSSGTFQKAYGPEDLESELLGYFQEARTLLARRDLLIARGGGPLPWRERKKPFRAVRAAAWKNVADNLYIHRAFTHLLPPGLAHAAAAAIQAVGGEFPFDIVKVHVTKHEVSLIRSPDFDNADEPEAGDSVKIFPDGRISSVRKGTGQVYHHKWTMVGDDYAGFDVARAKQRSELWENLPLPAARDKSRIGSAEFWNRHALWWVNRMQGFILSGKETP